MEPRKSSEKSLVMESDDGLGDTEDIKTPLQQTFVSVEHSHTLFLKDAARFAIDNMIL